MKQFVVTISGNLSPAQIRWTLNDIADCIAEDFPEDFVYVVREKNFTVDVGVVEEDQ